MTSRIVTVGAAQLGPIARDEPRSAVVQRLDGLLRQGADAGCDLAVFPERALTTFFPRWHLTDQAVTTGDEFIVARCDLDWCRNDTETLFDFDGYRRPDVDARLTSPQAVERG